MSRRIVIESFATKTTRNDRFAQMSRQEQVIEQKKREIQARLKQQQPPHHHHHHHHHHPKDTKGSLVTVSPSPTVAAVVTAVAVTTTVTASATVHAASSASTPKSVAGSETMKKSSSKMWKGNLGSKSAANSNNKTTAKFNMFSNDGSFLDQFKQLSDGKKAFDPKIQVSSFVKPEKGPDGQDRSAYGNEERVAKSSRWSKSRSTVFNKDSPVKAKVSRFSDPDPEPVVPSPIQPFLQATFAGVDMFPGKFNVQPPVSMGGFCVTTSILVGPPPVSRPPQQLGALIAPPPPTVSGISVPPPVHVPPPCMQPLELASIPAPTPIPVHTIPQPEPINARTIPPPAPLQLQNIPSPSPIRLNEIPNPKPIDLLNIPSPADEPTKLSLPNANNITDPDFIKNVPPPNKSVPPPNMGGNVPITELPNVMVPPPRTAPVVPTSIIPPLMAQPVLPPPGLVTRNAAPPQTTVSLPPPLLSVPPPAMASIIPGPPPVLNQPPPLAQTNRIPPMNFPPPVSAVVGPDMNAGSAGHDAMVSLGRMVAQCGAGFEDIVKQRSSQDPSLWFLFHEKSAAYHQYRQMVQQFRAELGNVITTSVTTTTTTTATKDTKITTAGCTVTGATNTRNDEYQPEDLYEPENITDDECDVKRRQDEETAGTCKRRRKSRWGEKVSEEESVPSTRLLFSAPPPMLNKVTRSDPGLLQYAVNTFGSTDLSEEEWVKCVDHYKINLLYQHMVRKREELERLAKLGKNKYEYDSDEEMDGGTWEHKLRMQEMEATQMWANELTRQAEGKHHIGDFLPPEELKRFMEKCSAVREGRQPNLSDYKEFKLSEDNIGFKMLQKLGWTEGQGLGMEGSGIVEPINKGLVRDQNQGLGLHQSENENDDEYDAYRKRMMLAYRFRPNPLNNPRRPYY